MPPIVVITKHMLEESSTYVGKPCYDPPLRKTRFNAFKFPRYSIYRDQLSRGKYDRTLAGFRSILGQRNQV